MSEAETGTGLSETVAWVLVAVAGAAGVVAVGLARRELPSGDACGLALATAGGARARASRAATKRPDERTRRE
jgi:predicted amino acid dehydrogenase